ncbi:HI0074 family nucleotidyltransferase substrate-binding subunit [Cetobacterium sp.]|uniref:HI0074 family nucleotidyltransferase substrate-binding subunit n=1 Tax=Cetobacterium sp. TaxID=2071632 RepID=UPI002FC91362
MYGLSHDDFFKIIEILKKYQSDIEWVKIFGSRARGDNKETSDIDIAISFIRDRLLKLKDDFYESDLKYTVDLIDYKKNKNIKLKKYIDEEGIIIFLTNSKGELLMNENKLKDKLEDYKKALKKLKIALEKDPHVDEIYLDGTIQRFEFVYELSWKLMKNYLEYQGIEVSSPRETFREGFKSNLIEDATQWINLMQNRNRTSHTYNEETAWDIYDKIKTEYIYLFESFLISISNKI